MIMKTKKRGMVMAYVMIIGLALTLLITALVFAVNMSANATRKAAHERRAYINAVSGIEATKAYIQSDVYAGARVNTDFYVYGSPENLQYMDKREFEQSGQDGSSFEVFASCTGDTTLTASPLPGGGSGLKVIIDFTVNSIGSYASAEPRSLEYEGSMELYYNSVLPILPDDFNSGIGGFGWYNPPVNGRAEINSSAANRVQDGTVVFPYPTYLKNNSDKDNPMMADTILFTHSKSVNNRAALEIEKNKSVSFAANLFAFYGDIIFPNQTGNTELIIEPCNPAYNPTFAPLTNAAELAAYGITGLKPGRDYGIIYFAPNVKCGSRNLGLEIGTFYLFPSKVDLSLAVSGSRIYGLDALIKITDLSLLNEITDGVIDYTYTGEPVSASLEGEVK